MIKNSLSAKLVLIILLFITPVFLILIYSSYKTSSTILLTQTEKYSESIGNHAIDKITIITEAIEKVPEHVAESLTFNKKNLIKTLKTSVVSNENIFGMAAAFEPYRFNPETELFCPYIYLENGFLTVTGLTDKDYDYLHQPWYLIPKKLKKPVWSEPYFDKGGGGVLMSTYSYPVIKNGKFLGIITADISMEKLNKIVSSVKVLKTGYAFLITKSGKFISHPNHKLIMSMTLQEYAEKNNNKDLMRISNEIKNGRTGFSSFTNKNKKYQVYYSPIVSTGWYIGVVFPYEELFAPLKKLTNQMLLIGFAGICLIVLAVIWSLRKIILRIKKLSKGVDIISKGDFDSELEIDSSFDELGRLSQAFESMRISLKEYMVNLEKVTANKQKIESELAIAKKIQMSILPKIFPPFPEKKELDIFATIYPAKEVGGDLYDFFFLDENYFCFLIGDVSGKGIPASLFMAVSKTLLKFTANAEKNPAQILHKVNNELVTNNDGCMFVTVFFGILNIKTGKVKFCNAGHNPPVMKSLDNTFLMKIKHNPALGIFPDTVYEEQSVVLKPGEIIFTYTDGINEAFNLNREQYSYDRLLKLLTDTENNYPQKIIEKVLKEVKSFVGEAPQSDDMTILCLKFKGD